MLPFLNKKRVAGVILSKRKPDGSTEIESAEAQEPKAEGNEGLNAAAAELIHAVHMKDEPGVARALRAAFDIMEAEPHEENEE